MKTGLGSKLLYALLLMLIINAGFAFAGKPVNAFASSRLPEKGLEGLRTSPAGIIKQSDYLKASNTGVMDHFGYAIALDGDTLVVGANDEDSNATGVNGVQGNNSAEDSGAVYVFVRSGQTWVQQAYLKASNTGAYDSFGGSVAISGDTLVVGAREEDSSATGVNGSQGNNDKPNSGAAYVFVRNGTTWSQQAYLKASNTETGNWFGNTVAIDGDTIAVSSVWEDSSATGVNSGVYNTNSLQSGAAYVFVRSGTMWSQQAYIKASNTQEDDYFGASVSLSADTLVVGAIGEGSIATGSNGDETNNDKPRSGAAFVFVRNGTTWSQQAYLKASNPDIDDWFGYAVGISGDTIVVGASGECSNATGINGDQTNNDTEDAGAAYVFVRNGTTWSQQAYLKASNTEWNMIFGGDLAISGDTLIISAYWENGGATGVNGDQSLYGVAYSGAVYLFTRIGTNWQQQAYIKASNTGSFDWFGSSVAISDKLIVIGADSERSSATGINGDQDNDDTFLSGAVYVFVTEYPVFVPCLVK